MQRGSGGAGERGRREEGGRRFSFPVPSSLSPVLIFLFALLFPLSPALAQPCTEQPYTLTLTLETADNPNTPDDRKKGILGGGNLEYEGELAVFSDGACLQTQGISITAPQIRFSQTDEVVLIENLEGSTPRFRFWAARGTVKGGVLNVEGMRVTTCRCGDELRLISENISLDTVSGDIVLKQSRLELWGIGLLSFEGLSSNLSRNVADDFGLGRVSSDFAALSTLRFGIDGGVSFGLENLALPLARAPGQAPVLFTLLGSGLGSSSPTLTFGLSSQQGDRRGRFAIEGQNSSSLVQTPNVLFSHDTREARYGFRASETLHWDNFSLTPFGQMAREKSEQGLAYGAELRHAVEAREQGFRFRLESFGAAVGYDQPQFYLAFGGRIEGGYEGAFGVKMAYDWTIDSRSARFWLERHEATQRFSLVLSQGPSSLGLEYNALTFASTAFARTSTRQDYGELWLDARLRYREGAWERQELILGFVPNPLTCTDSLSLSPTLGYDFMRQSVSRFGLEVRYADCCFVWRLGYSEVRIPQAGTGEAATGKWVFGVELR